MSDIEDFIGLLACIQEADESIRIPADQQLQSMRKADPIKFTILLHSVIEMASNPSIPTIIICLAMTLARQQFRRSTKIRAIDDPSLSWALIPPDLTSAYADTLYPLFCDSRACISDFSAKLLAQVSAYSISWCASAIVRVIQDLPTMPGPCAIFFHSLLDEITIPAEIQIALFRAVWSILTDQSLPLESTPPLVGLLGQLHSVFSRVLDTPDDSSAFLNAMIAITAIPEISIKTAAYFFWQQTALFETSLLASCPEIISRSAEDLSACNADVSRSIHEFWTFVSDCHYSYGDDTLGIFETGVRHLLPQFFEDALIFESARDAIQSFAFSYPSFCLPSMLSFAQHFSDTASAPHRELALWMFGAAARSDSSHASGAALFLAPRLADALPSVRALAMQTVADLPLDCENCRGLVPPLLAHIPGPLEADAALALSALASMLDPFDLSELLLRLVATGRPAALGCASDVLRRCGSPEIAFPILERSIALISGVGDAAIDLVDALFRILGESATVYSATVFDLVGATSASPHALLAMATIAGLDSAFLARAIAGITPGLAPDADPLVQRAAVECVAFLAGGGIDPVFHELVGRLFEVMRSTADVELQCRCLVAINGLHAGRTDAMQPYYSRLVPVAASAVECWAEVERDDEELAGEVWAAAMELVRVMMGAVAGECGRRCAEIAMRGLAIVPRMAVVSQELLIEAVELLDLIAELWPCETEAFLEENEAVAEVLVRQRNHNG
jgi:hypothetical protein